MPDTIRTARLVLRQARSGDVGAIHAIMSDPATMRHGSAPPHPDIAATRLWLAEMIGDARVTRCDYIVTLDGAVIGKLGAWRWPEVGFFLSRRHWGRGYAGEALAAFVAHAFADRMDHLIADVDPENLASLRVLTRAGFRKIGPATDMWRAQSGWGASVSLRLDRPRSVPTATAA